MQGEQEPSESNVVELNQVTFGYQEQAVLKDVSIRFASGSFTALVGPSGSGKSTILRMIARFYDPSHGMVTLGGGDMRSMDPEALLRKVTMVFQDVYLFQDTIANNIRFGKSGASQLMIEEAAKKACCHEFIMKLPSGYDTMVGEGGSTLSGGEKQRISIARAILKDAPIVLLDEATASLDPENEAEIQKAINQLVQGKTVIAIAHRLKTIRNANQILVLNEGRIAEQGQHDELLALGGLYARMWTLQQETSGWGLSNKDVESIYE
ncbi:Lipid A export ATP-binding/permease protein MsbA [compost metagenome]